MKYMKYSGVALVTLGLLVGCGSSSSSSSITEDSADTIEKATGYYLDAAVAGVTYICGTESNVTGADGSFTFDVNESCVFSLNGITLRTVDGSLLENNGTNIFEDNTTVAQFLQSLDKDGNSSNGLNISEEIVDALGALNINSLPTDYTELNNTITLLQNRSDENSSFEFGGSPVNEADAETHLDNTRREYNITTDITDKILTNGSGNCADFVLKYISSVTDVSNDTDFAGSLEIEVEDSTCTFTANSIPNHDFNDGTGFTHNPAEVTGSYSITTSPTKANAVTELTIGWNQAIMLNGVPASLKPLGCYGIDDGVKSCTDNNQPWRANPGSGYGSFKIDSHNAHTQASGMYHYHATPVALFDTTGDIESPVVGFAADGFPIYGSYYKDSDNNIVKIDSSYQLKTVIRESQTYDGIEYLPSATSSEATFHVNSDSYDGQYEDDYDYNASKSLLDECNGMTLNGQYAYYVTDEFPYMIGCFTGTRDDSFSN